MLPSPCHLAQAAERLSMAGCWQSTKTKKDVFNETEETFLNTYFLEVRSLHTSKVKGYELSPAFFSRVSCMALRVGLWLSG